jgi:stearoyl-CoA desaturase (delta-9 desaturase)
LAFQQKCVATESGRELLDVVSYSGDSKRRESVFSRPGNVNIMINSVETVGSNRPVEVQHKVSILSKAGILGATIIPLLGLATGIVLVWGWGVSWLDLGLLAGFYLLTAIGITVGFHRLLVHRSFETSKVVKVILGALGSMAVQGSVFMWVARHRQHHHHSDTLADPHSPHRFTGSLLGRLRGFWHAHIGWAFGSSPDLRRYVLDLKKSRSLSVVSALFPAWLVLGLVLPAVLGGLITGTWAGAGTGFIWGGLVRIFLVHHVTWCVNSVGHIWGAQPFRSSDQSRNNFLVGVFALGEGWHNTHHAFPTSARHGLKWWQLDMSYWFIRLMAMFGLAWNVRVPTADAIARQSARA